MSSEQPPMLPEPPPSRRRPLAIPAGITIAVTGLFILGGFMIARANGHTNKVALASSGKAVGVVIAKQAVYRETRKYVGTLEPWIEAKLGPQYTAAYVDTVLVRPGTPVKRGQILATLDCRNASAESRAVAMQARALESQQEALSHEAARVEGLLGGGYASANEVEQKTAESASKQAELLAAKAKVMRTSLEVNDCILHSPFDGEVSGRFGDPGTFARPGTPIVSVVDRGTIRIAADVPETDFAFVAPGREVRIHVVATAKDFTAKIVRRSPSADPATRTVHFEIDVPDPSREIPVGTTAELEIDVGEPEPATEIPLIAASVRGQNATVFVVQGDVAHRLKVAVKGEAGSNLYVETALRPGSSVVTENRNQLKDGDRVASDVPASSEAKR